MDPAPLDPAEHLRRLRQQVILAQVRVMELEDERDAARHDLAAADQRIAEAQTLADAQTERADHLARTLETHQAEFQHLRHVQHVTNEALNDTRSRLAALETELTAARATAERLAADLQATLGEHRRTHETLDAAQAEVVRQGQRLMELDREQRALKASRSWRWTAWLRAIERALGRS